MDYERLPDPGEGLRLHLNENTGGCSPKVLDALRAVTAEQVAFYPDYGAATQACADLFGVDREWVALTNGLDEGIWAAATACLTTGGPGAEAVIPVPTFDMYAACVDAVGGKAVTVPPGPGLAFPRAAVLQAVRDATRLVYLCSPGNPSGRAIAGADISAVSAALPPGALLFLDEAYADFGRGSFLPWLAACRNVVVGRTFAKAYGLAALRIGCVIAHPEALSIVRRAIPPYSLNVCAIAALGAAIGDRRHHDWYCAQVSESRQLIYDACSRLGLSYWPSEANFVLVHVGRSATALVEALARRRIFIRDRSDEPGCAGAVRITAGVVEHTRACIAAMEEFLCASR
jgi:histidinol-phosphate aminotransferase